ncbi:MAG: HD domain-containing phosphohydrolase [Pseudomonadota bacterium]
MSQEDDHLSENISGQISYPVDPLSEIGQSGNLIEKVVRIHALLEARYPFLHRISAALYDPKTDLVKTFVHSSRDEPLPHYQAKLADAPSLKEIVERGRPRVVSDLKLFEESSHEHAKRIVRQGYRSSYTMPMYAQGVFFGFLFFNSYEKGVFTDVVVHEISPFGHLVALIVISHLQTVETLVATVKTARDMVQVRDFETGSHLNRMSRFARLIARGLADKYGFSDEYIESIFMFSPLHDIGKIGIPDSILLKAAKLTEAEFETMKTHASKGRELVDQMLGNFNLGRMQYVEVLRNIAELHHEAMDGSGYPYGHRGENIPIEARIVAVADVFDALTSSRPYKEAWDNNRAFALLQSLSGIKFDADCVDVLVASRAEVEEIQAYFEEDMLG